MKKQTNAQILELANLAASYLIEGGADSFQSAKQKAARAMGLASTKSLPTNIDLQRALAENLSLFEGDDWRARVQAMRNEALEAMAFFSPLDVHLVGSALYGTATAYSAVTLHIYCDDFEQVVWRLRDANISFRVTVNLLRTDHKASSKSAQEFPAIELVMNDFDFDIVVFPLNFLFNSACSPLDGKPFQRADANKVKELLDDDIILFGKYLLDASEQST